MDLFRAFDVSASGLSAQRTRMEVITENLANAESPLGPGGRVYRRKVPMLQAVDGGASFAAALGGASTPRGGVRVAQVVESGDTLRRVYQPGHPMAGPDGFLTLPNVNPLVEMVDMLMTTRAYEANATAFQASKSMAAKLIEILK
jgi:flagellar basal-body rod protein FlgC